MAKAKPIYPAAQFFVSMVSLPCLMATFMAVMQIMGQRFMLVMVMQAMSLKLAGAKFMIM